MIDDRNERI